VRVCTAFNRMLRLPGAWVSDVAFGGEGVIVTVCLRRRRRVCSGCGARRLEIKDRRVKRWRHLDLGSSRCFIECELRRLRCPGCGERPEAVEWAFTRAKLDSVIEKITRHEPQPLALAA
jgi:transposase